MFTRQFVSETAEQEHLNFCGEPSDSLDSI